LGGADKIGVRQVTRYRKKRGGGKSEGRIMFIIRPLTIWR